MDSVQRYMDLVEKCGFYSSGENLRFYCEFIFDKVNFEGKKVLDIGGGSGLLSFWAACNGASSVVCLEPMLEGSSSRPAETFEQIQEMANLRQVTLLPKRFQDYHADFEEFDIIVLDNSINHLDEIACTQLHEEDKLAVASYNEIFRKIAAIMQPSGILVITDCGRRNLFGDLRLPNPFAHTINWKLHQQPKLWQRMITKAGFSDSVIRWIPPNRSRRLGRILLSNRYASYLLNSHFCIRMKKTSSC